MAQQVKLQDLKKLAFQAAQELGLGCTQTAHFKRRRLTVGLDMRCKASWIKLINRLKELAGGVVVPFLRCQPIAA